jgi:hypothetical protein
MIAQDSDSAVVYADAAEGAGKRIDCSGDGSSIVAVDVARQGKKVGLQAVEQPPRGIGNRRQNIEMWIADMEDSVTIEFARKGRKGEGQAPELQIQRISTAATVDGCQPYCPIERHEKAIERSFPPPRPAARWADPVSAGFHFAAAVCPTLHLDMRRGWPRLDRSGLF